MTIVEIMRRFSAASTVSYGIDQFMVYVETGHVKYGFLATVTSGL